MIRPERLEAVRLFDFIEGGEIENCIKMAKLMPKEYLLQMKY